MNCELRFKIIISVIRQNIGRFLLDIFTLIGSAATIYQAYFVNPFDMKSLMDWGVAVFIAFIVIVFLWRNIGLFVNWHSLDLEKDTFFEFISNKVKRATNTIKNIAGDLSWLEKQKDVYKEIRDSNPSISIKIYYCEEIINSQTTKDLIQEYKSFGIEMIPYPFEIQTHYIKGLLIDYDENAKFYSFHKKDSNQINCLRYDKNANEYCFAQTFLESVDNYIKLKKSFAINIAIPQPKRTVFIGISGLNNIGKSTLCLYLKLKFGNRIKVIEDSFIGDTKHSSFEIALFCLLNQLFEFNRLVSTGDTQEDIFIFDRTPIDNYAFINIYKNPSSNLYDRYIRTLENEIKIFMKSFSLVALLIPEDKHFRYKKTSVLDTNTRKRVYAEINHLYQKIYSSTTTKYRVKKYKKDSDFKKRINEIAEDISGKIDNW